jgi:2-iminoacetate synthase ThiH
MMLLFIRHCLRQLNSTGPDLHVKALTPVEYHYIFKKAKIDYATGMKLMKDAGLRINPWGRSRDLSIQRYAKLLQRTSVPPISGWQSTKNGIN